MTKYIIDILRILIHPTKHTKLMKPYVILELHVVSFQPYNTEKPPIDFVREGEDMKRDGGLYCKKQDNVRTKF